MAVPATVSRALVLEYKDLAGDWQPFGGPMDLGSLVRRRRIALGPRLAQVAREWRLVKKAGEDWGDAVFTMDALRFWQETNELSEVRIHAFSFDDQLQRYFLVQTDRNIEVYHADVRVASLPSPHTSAQVPTVRRAQVLDTMIQFHPDQPTSRITRQGAHDQWDRRPLAFDALPLFDYTGQRLGGVDEVQQLQFRDYLAGDTFNLTIEGEVTTGTIAFNASAAVTAASIQTALEGLPNIGVGGVAVADAGGDNFDVTFKAQNRGEDIGELAPKTISSAEGLAQAITLVAGKEGGEPIISAARGYPACGAFHQGRLWMAGLKSRPQTALASRVGDWFNFTSQGTQKAISIDLDTDETTVIRAMFPGQHLQLFTGSAEFYFPVEPITPPPPVKRATRRGISDGLPLAEIEGATLFITAGGAALAEFLYDDSRATYGTSYLSKYASHLLAGTDDAPTSIIGMGFRRARTPEDTDRAILIRADGDAAVMHALRADDVTGFFRWTTAGHFLAAEADLARDEYLAVRRAVNAADTEIMIEKVDPAAMLDSQVRIAGPATEITGVAHLNLQNAVLYIDGSDAGDVVPFGETLALPYPALREVHIGRLFVPKVILLPPVLENDPRAGKSIAARAGILDVEFGPSGNVKGGVLGGKLFRFPMKRRPGDLNDQGPGEAAFQGWSQLIGLSGWRFDAQVQIVQERPGPLEIKQIVATIES